jgi:hypothetical protein
MARTLGCCGAPSRPVSIAALVARADQLPPSSPQGRAARARLFYTVAAGKAAQAGNRYAYERAMAGLRGANLADAASDAAAARQRFVGLINSAGSGMTDAVLERIRMVSGIASLVAQLGVSIMRAAGAPADVTNAVDSVFAVLRALLVPPASGSAPSLPPMDANTMRAFATFCTTYKSAVTASVSALFGGIAAGYSASAIAKGARGDSAGATSDGQTAQALGQVAVWVNGVLDGICADRAVVTFIEEQALNARAAACVANAGPNAWINPANDTCECMPGFAPSSTRTATGSATCVALPGEPIILSAEIRARLRQAAQQAGTPGAPPLTTAQQRLLVSVGYRACAPGEIPNPCTGVCDGIDYRGLPRCVNGVPTKAASGGAAVWALPALALAWYFTK